MFVCLSVQANQNAGQRSKKHRLGNVQRSKKHRLGKVQRSKKIGLKRLKGQTVHRSEVFGVEESESIGGFSKFPFFIVLVRERVFYEKDDFVIKFDQRFSASEMEPVSVTGRFGRVRSGTGHYRFTLLASLSYN